MSDCRFDLEFHVLHTSRVRLKCDFINAYRLVAVHIKVCTIILCFALVKLIDFNKILLFFLNLSLNLISLLECTLQHIKIRDVRLTGVRCLYCRRSNAFLNKV